MFRFKHVIIIFILPSAIYPVVFDVSKLKFYVIIFMNNSGKFDSFLKPEFVVKERC